MNDLDLYALDDHALEPVPDPPGREPWRGLYQQVRNESTTKGLQDVEDHVEDDLDLGTDDVKMPEMADIVAGREAHDMLYPEGLVQFDKILSLAGVSSAVLRDVDDMAPKFAIGRKVAERLLAEQVDLEKQAAADAATQEVGDAKNTG